MRVAALQSLLRQRAPTVSAYVLSAALFIAATAYTPGFAAPTHVRQLLIFASFVGFAALGQTFVILAGGLDLTVPWLMAFGGIQLSHWTGTTGLPGWVNIILAVAAGCGVGLVNGIGVAFLRVPPIIMTLGVGGLVQAYLLSIGLLQSQGNRIPQIAVTVAYGKVGPVPVIPLIWLGVAIGASVILSRTAFGRRLYAVGSNDVVARFSGVNVMGVRIATYAVSGATSVFAGILLSGYIGTAYLDIGAPYLFASIAAVAVGGASILGGRGSYWGSVAGALTLTFLSAMLPLFNLNNAALDIVYGAVIIVGVYLSRLSVLFARRGGSAS
ncbi:MAG TPA: ABC transporter permease [Gaiellaceae bacterium]